MSLRNRTLSLSLCMVVAALPGALQAAPPAPPRDASWTLLSDNAAYLLPRHETGATYELHPQATNPSDGKREVPALQDAEEPVANWHAAVGWGSSGTPEAQVDFDLNGVHEIVRVDSLLMSVRHPDAIRVEVRENESTEWREVGRAPVDASQGSRFWTSVVLDEPTEARHVRVVYEADSAYHVREVYIWGNLLADDPGRVRPADGSDSLVLIDGNQPRAAIVVGGDESETGWAAARLLQDFLKRLTGVMLPVIEGTETLDAQVPRILVGPQAANAAGLEIEQGYPDATETYHLRRAGRSLILAGNDEASYRGSMLAVAHFLELQGARFYRYDDPEHYWVIPQLERVAVDELNIEAAPTFVARRASTWPMTYAPKRELWRIFNRFGGVAISYGHRTFIGEEAFQDHPEWFSYRDGERRNPAEHRNWQICTTNPEVIDLVVEQVAQRFRENPQQMSAALSARDRPGFCQCEDCTAIEGNLGDRWSTFANTVRRELNERYPEFRDRKLMFYAYWHMREPPQHTELAPGVIPMFVGDGCHAHPWTADSDTCPNQRRMRGWFEGWRDAASEPIGIYEWYIPGHGPGMAGKRWERFPWFVYRKPFMDAQYLARNGVSYINYEQTKKRERHGQFWLPYYMAARAMWDPQQNPDELLREICDNLYGNAADTMLQLYHLFDEAMLQADTHTGSWRLPNPAEIYSSELVVHVNHLLERAMKEAAGNEHDQHRVREVAKHWETGWEWLVEVDGPEADPLNNAYRP